MNKNLIIVGSVAGLLGVIYLYFKRQASNPVLGIPAPANLPQSAPRVDNQSQPWYAGVTSFLKVPQQGYDQNSTTATLAQGASVIHSLSDIWSDVSGFFGSDGDSSTAADVDYGYFMSDDLPNWDLDQSNVMGDIYAWNDMDFSVDSYDSGDWGLDESDSESWGFDNIA